MLIIRVLDEMTGKVHGAYLRLRFDSWSRMVIGYEVKFEPPWYAAAKMTLLTVCRPPLANLSGNQKPLGARLIEVLRQPNRRGRFENLIERMFQILTRKESPKLRKKRGTDG
jgi:hypothetical protein